MFWLIVVGLGAFIAGIWFTFNTILGPDSMYIEDISQDKVVELQSYLGEAIRCTSSLNSFGTYREGDKFFLHPKPESIDIFSKEKLKYDYTEVKVKGRINGQVVTFWIKDSFIQVDSKGNMLPFLIYLSDLDGIEYFTEATSLLGRDRFNIVIPYISVGRDTLYNLRTDSFYSHNNIETYFINEIATIVDYLEILYKDVPIIAYGEEYGSELARINARLDNRIDLVISNKYSGDPLGVLQKNGLYSNVGQKARLYISNLRNCNNSGISSFSDLVPVRHLYLGPSSGESEYQMGTRIIAKVIEEEYKKSGYGSRFQYLELEDLSETGTREVLTSISNILSSN